MYYSSHASNNTLYCMLTLLFTHHYQTFCALMCMQYYCLRWISVQSIMKNVKNVEVSYDSQEKLLNFRVGMLIQDFSQYRGPVYWIRKKPVPGYATPPICDTEVLVLTAWLLLLFFFIQVFWGSKAPRAPEHELRLLTTLEVHTLDVVYIVYHSKIVTCSSRSALTIVYCFWDS